MANIIDLTQILFKNDIPGFLDYLKLHKLNKDAGPTHAPSFGNDEVSELGTYFVNYFKDVPKKTIFMPNVPQNVPREYYTDTMLNTVGRFNKNPELFCCASGDLILMRTVTINGKEYEIPFHLELKISENDVYTNKDGKRSFETGSIPKTTVMYFAGITQLYGMKIRCPHLYLLCPKRMAAPNGKICIVNANKLNQMANSLTYTKSNTDPQTEILLYKNIPDDIKVDLNEWVINEQMKEIGL